MNGYWCTPWASNPSAGSNPVCGRSNSYTPPPFLNITMNNKIVIKVAFIFGEVIAGDFASYIICNHLTLIFSLFNVKLPDTLGMIINLSAIILISSFMVYFIGGFNSKSGSYVFVLLGSFSGLIASILVGIAIPSNTAIEFAPWSVLIVLPSIGAAIGFNLKKRD